MPTRFSLRIPKSEAERAANSLLPNRGLPAQTAEWLSRQIAAGHWRDWLPGERRLCKQLQISRGTLRAALQILRSRDAIHSVGGRGNRIRPKVVRGKPTSVTGVIGVLSPEPLEVSRPYFALRFDHMQKLAAARGWRIERVHGAIYFGSRSAPQLQQLVEEIPCECWVLMHSNERVQRWFATSKVPCVVAGGPYPGIPLPAADVDYRALGRHATGHLLRLGHRRIGLLVARQMGPGIVEGLAGFRAACSAHHGDPVTPVVLTHDNRMATIEAVLTRSFSRPNHPTALMIETSNQYIAASSVLTRLGLRAPEDVSLLSWISDPFLNYFVPVPCRYEVDPKRSAGVLLRLVNRRLNGTASYQKLYSVMPQFILGASTAPPRA